MRETLKPILSRSIGLFGGIINDFILDNALTVFVYHDVSDHPSEFSRTFNLNVSLTLFDFQIEFIKNNFNIISPDDLMKSEIPPKAALITFDDGFKSYFKNAVPVLAGHEIPSIIFLNMEPVRGAVFWSGLITYLHEKNGSFINYLKSYFPETVADKPLYLSCSRNIVNTFLEETGESYEKEVADFVGEVADEEDMIEASVNPLVFYGNHLFNHDVPLLLTDEELLNSFFRNSDELEKYSNYRNMFAFPFGQPDTCFSDSQVELLHRHGAIKIFSANGDVNPDGASFYLHRISLGSFNNTPAKIWFQICNRTLRKHLRLN